MTLLPTFGLPVTMRRGATEPSATISVGERTPHTDSVHVAGAHTVDRVVDERQVPVEAALGLGANWTAPSGILVSTLHADGSQTGLFKGHRILRAYVLRDVDEPWEEPLNPAAELGVDLALWIQVPVETHRVNTRHHRIAVGLQGVTHGPSLADLD